MSEVMTMTRAAPSLALTKLSDYLQLAEAVGSVFGGAPVALVKILAGAELGFGALASLTGVHVIEGKPSVGSHLIAAAIKRSDKYDYEVVERDGIKQTTDAVCEIEFFERVATTGHLSRKFTAGWKSAGRLRYTIEEAHSKGWHLTSKGAKSPWVKTPRNMLFARVIVDGYKTFCPDLSGGVLTYDPDELDASPAADPRPPVDAEFAVVPANGRQSAPAIVTDPNASTPATGTDATEITEEQLDVLRSIYREKKRTPEDVSTMLASVGVKTLPQLPPSLLSWASTILSDGQITVEQSDRIHRLAEGRRLPWETLEARVQAKYGVERLKLLSQPQAAEVERALGTNETLRGQPAPSLTSASAS